MKIKFKIRILPIVVISVLLMIIVALGKNVNENRKLLEKKYDKANARCQTLNGYLTDELNCIAADSWGNYEGDMSWEEANKICTSKGMKLPSLFDLFVGFNGFQDITKNPLKPYWSRSVSKNQACVLIADCSSRSDCSLKQNNNTGVVTSRSCVPKNLKLGCRCIKYK